ncbi:MAG: hypothetical protein VX443_07350, partial [Pseudomonadota bacterium]|nr:hypothetical protein [Pseudomonadota bacterium]
MAGPADQIYPLLVVAPHIGLLLNWLRGPQIKFLPSWWRRVVTPADQSVPELVAGYIINQPHLAITTAHHNGAKSPTIVTLHVINIHL